MKRTGLVKKLSKTGEFKVNNNKIAPIDHKAATLKLEKLASANISY
jgi:hypothetical protein